LKDLTGQRFGRLVVERREGSIDGQAAWICKCDCGGTKRVRGYQLRSGKTASCGCLWLETITKHRLCGTPEYNTWCHMISRCHDSENDSYENYGGRGIVVCDRWRYSFECFLADMGKRPPKTSLDRVDNSGNYEPGNCRWATRLEQNRNTRKNVRYTVNGETLHLAEWARRLNVRASVLSDRLKRGWPPEKALTTPILKKAG
jgi:hypothetical protein